VKQSFVTKKFLRASRALVPESGKGVIAQVNGTHCGGRENQIAHENGGGGTNRSPRSQRALVEQKSPGSGGQGLANQKKVTLA